VRRCARSATRNHGTAAASTQHERVAPTASRRRSDVYPSGSPMSGLPEPKTPRPGFGLIKRFALAALLIVLLSAGATATAGLLEVKSVADIIKTGKTIPGIDNVLDDVSGGGPQTILVLGSDRRYGDAKGAPARSDTIMLIRLDPSKEATAVMSIPRDLLVDIPGLGRDRINAAYNGGPKRSVQTVKNLLDIGITHVVNVNFNGFQRAVNKLGCVYIDVDRRYFNDNDPPRDSASNYATIDLKPGYQKLCGHDSLDYVRFRHLDDDYVRAARQQGFLRQGKDQFGTGKLFGSRDELLKIFARYTQTDVRSTSAILKLLKLVFESSGHPIRTVHFNVYNVGDAVAISPPDLATARSEFLDARASKGPPPKKTRSTTKPKKTKKSKKGATPPAAGIIHAHKAMEDYVADASTRVDFPLYYTADRYFRGNPATDGARVYDIYDRGHKKYRAYRIVLWDGDIGQYYGVQGTTWTSPPILDDPSETRKIGGRKFDLYFDGSRLRLIAYRTPRAVYWISNTLSQDLTNKQMFSLARSLRAVGS
jgi:LCP family protein required for cell wall assembly